MQFTADQVWGLAVRADTLNNGYLKEDKWEYINDQVRKIGEANKVLVKQWLRDNVQPTEAEIVKGQEYRAYFKTFTMKALTGQLNDFERQAMKIAAKDEFTGRDMIDFAIVSCLPSTARRDKERTELKRDIYASEQLVGNIGDTIVGDITVVSSRFNANYNKWRVQARMGESFIDFWFGKEVKGECRIKGKIKNVRCGEKTTQLNYVKIIG